jgi:hypothetical protein
VFGRVFAFFSSTILLIRSEILHSFFFYRVRFDGFVVNLGLGTSEIDFNISALYLYRGLSLRSIRWLEHLFLKSRLFEEWNHPLEMSIQFESFDRALFKPTGCTNTTNPESLASE